MSKLRLGVVMDPIDNITPAKDSTLAMLLAAQDRGYELLEEKLGACGAEIERISAPA